MVALTEHGEPPVAYVQVETATNVRARLGRSSGHPVAAMAHRGDEAPGRAIGPNPQAAPSGRTGEGAPHVTDTAASSAATAALQTELR
jgi:hypothetical protein